MLPCGVDRAGQGTRNLRFEQSIFFILAEWMVSSRLPPVVTLPTHCHREGTVRQRTLGSGLARGLEGMALQIDALHGRARRRKGYAICRLLDQRFSRHENRRNWLRDGLRSGELPLCEVLFPLGTCRARRAFTAPTGSSTRQLRRRSRARRPAALGRFVPLVSAHPRPGGQKICELVCELNRKGASADDVVFLDHMSLWQEKETVPKLSVEQNKVTGARSDGEVTLPDRTEPQLKEFNFALFETSRLFAFAGGNLPDGSEVKGCRVLVQPGQLHGFPESRRARLDRKHSLRTSSSLGEDEVGILRERALSRWRLDHHRKHGGTLHTKRAWPTSVEEFAAMMDEQAKKLVMLTKRSDRDAVRFNFWKYCFRIL